MAQRVRGTHIAPLTTDEKDYEPRTDGPNKVLPSSGPMLPLRGSLSNSLSHFEKKKNYFLLA